MVVTIRGKVGSKQYPALFRFLDPLDLRTFHGRSLLCLLVDKAISLTEEDRIRYGAVFLSLQPSSEAGLKGARRFLISISEDDHPETVERVVRFGAEKVEQPRFLHLLEVAAGLMITDSGSLLTKPVNVPPQPAIEESARVGAGEQLAPPVVSTTEVRKQSTYPSAAAGVIGSTVNHGAIADIAEGDLEELFS